MNNEDTDFTEPSDEGTAGTTREGVPTDRRPLGFWLRTVDGLITREFAAAFDGAEIDRRDWMLLNALSGDVETPSLAERFIRKGKRLRALAERGWVQEQGDGTWALTDEGRAAKEQLGQIVDGIRSRVAGSVSPEDYATTTASLEAIARELGWEDGQRMPRRGFGRDFGRRRSGPASVPDSAGASVPGSAEAPGSVRASARGSVPDTTRLTRAMARAARTTATRSTSTARTGTARTGTARTGTVLTTTGTTAAADTASARAGRPSGRMSAASTPGSRADARQTRRSRRTRSDTF